MRLCHLADRMIADGSADLCLADTSELLAVAIRRIRFGLADPFQRNGFKGVRILCADRETNCMPAVARMNPVDHQRLRGLGRSAGGGQTHLRGRIAIFANGIDLLLSRHTVEPTRRSGGCTSGGRPAPPVRFTGFVLQVLASVSGCAGIRFDTRI